MIEALIDQCLVEVEKHPPVFTTRALAYLSAARFGLSEEELNHALATDPQVMAEFEAQNARTGQEWLIDPDHPRLPPVLWSRLYFDLAPYLVSAFTDQILLYRWFSREFGEVIAQRYLATAEQRETTHGHLTEMFEARAPGNDDLFRRTDISAQPQAPALRRVMEQPWQLAQAGRQAELKKLLSDFGFCLGKCAANQGGELVEDWSAVKAEPSSEPAQWRRFMLRQGHYLRRGEARWPAHKILLQLASEDEPGSPVRHAAEQWLEQGHCDWVWLKRKNVPGQRRHNQTLMVLEGHSDAVLGTKVLADGRILSWSRDHTLRLWDGSSGACVAVMEGHTDKVWGAEVLQDGRILSWSDDSTLRLWDGETGAALIVMEGHSEAISGAELLQDGRILSWSWDGTLRLWAGDSGAPLAVMEGHSEAISGAEILPDGRILSWSSDGALRLWDGNSGVSLVLMAGHAEQVWAAELMPDGRILSWSWDGTLRLWDGDSGAPLAVMEGHTEVVSGVELLPDGRILSWSDDATLRLWNGDSGSSLAVMQGHSHRIEGVQVLSSGCILSWSKDGALRLWDGDSGESTVVLRGGRRQALQGMQMLSDSLLLFWSIGNEEGTLRMLNSEGEQLGAIKQPWIESAIESGWCKPVLENMPLTQACGDTLAETPDMRRICLASKDGKWFARWQGDVSKIVACLYGRLVVISSNDLIVLSPMRGSKPFALDCQRSS